MSFGGFRCGGDDRQSFLIKIVQHMFKEDSWARDVIFVGFLF